MGFANRARGDIPTASIQQRRRVHLKRVRSVAPQQTIEEPVTIQRIESSQPTERNPAAIPAAKPAALAQEYANGQHC
jgi:hypothetical protein